MSKKDDNRDVFEKALDYAPIAGAALGGALGSRIGRRKSMRAKKAAKEADDEFMAESKIEAERPGMLIRASQRFSDAESKTLLADANYRAARAARGRNTAIGAGVGGYAGYETSRKRRK